MASIARDFVGDDIVKRVFELANITKERRPHTGNTNLVHPIPAHLREDPALVHMREELSRHVSLPLTHFEPLIIWEFRPGMTCTTQMAAPHHDWTCQSESHHDPSILPYLRIDDDAVACPWVRLVTAILYLNTVPPGWGGRTLLPKANLSTLPRAGTLFAFRSVDARGRKDAWAAHAGECLRQPTAPTLENEQDKEREQRWEEGIGKERKLVAVQYIRASPFDSFNVGDRPAPEFYDFSYTADLEEPVASSDSEEGASGSGNAAAGAHARAWRELRRTWRDVNYIMKTGPPQDDRSEL